MERHVGLSLLSVGTEVSGCVCHLKFLGNRLMSIFFFFFFFFFFLILVYFNTYITNLQYMLHSITYD